MEVTDLEIADFLRNDPAFFERNPSLLTEIVLPNQHGGVAVSLVERQQLAQRDKIRVLETKMSELLQFGEENDVIGERVHRLALALIEARDVLSMTAAVSQHLHEDFKIPHVLVSLWTQAEQDSLSEQDIHFRSWLEGLAVPYCGRHPGLDEKHWFGETGAPLKSFAIVPLLDQTNILGALVMASEDEHRFYPEMGTLFLKRIGEMVCSCLSRCNC